MKQVLPSSVLVGLLSVSAIGATLDPVTNNVTFVDTNIAENSSDKQANTLDLSSSNWIYNLSSTNTISLGVDVQYVKINGGVKAENGGVITFNFGGVSNPGQQKLEFGTSDNASDSQLIQTDVCGKIIFSFNSNGTSDNVLDYILNGAVAGAGILNDGEMTFNLAKYSNLMFDKNIENHDGDLFINFDDGSILQHNPVSNIVNSSSGKAMLKFNNFANRARLTVDKVELQSSSSGSIELVFENASTELQAVFENNKTTTTKNDFVFNLKGNSFALLENHNTNGLGGDTSSNLKGIAFSFFSSGNMLSLFTDAKAGKVGAIEMKWLDVKSSGNYISLAPINELSTNKLIFTDILMPRKNKFTFLEIGDSIVPNSGISGNGMKFIVYANVSKKGLLGEIQPDKMESILMLIECLSILHKTTQHLLLTILA